MNEKVYTPAPQPFLVIPSGDHVQAAEVTTREIDVAVRDLLARHSIALVIFCRNGELISRRASGFCSHGRP